MKKHVVWIIILSTIQVLLLAAVAVKLVFFTGTEIRIDPESKQIVKSNIFYDDGGVYTAYLTVSDNRKFFMNEKWFTKIKDDISHF